MAKRSIESDDTSLVHKRPRLTPKALFSSDIVKEADLILRMIPGMEVYIKDNHQADNAQHLETVGHWRHTCEYAKEPDAPWTEAIIAMLDKRLPNENLMFRSYNEIYESFSSKQKLFSLPGPYALTVGSTQLKERLSQSSPLTYPSSTPRIYRSCVLSNQSISGQLTFISKLDSTNSNRFMLTASLLKSPSESIPVLVKLVYGQYGDDVHRLLDEHNLAPKSHTVPEVEGPPKAYAMEYLDPSSWKALSDYSDSSAFAASIRLSIDNVLDILQSSGKVHGDLRAPNAMIDFSSAGKILIPISDVELGEGRANIKIVDFDRGGHDG